MSFYGNISNAGKTNLTFDKIYANRKQMDQYASTDDVYIGRYVLVEYDDNTFSYREGYLKESSLPQHQNKINIYSDVECNVPFQITNSSIDETYGLLIGDIVYVDKGNKRGFYVCEEGEVGESQVFTFLDIASQHEGFSDYTINYNIDKKSYGDYFPKEGWDSTVWQKVVENGQSSYIMIANLNSELPEFVIRSEGPTLDPVAPHFGSNSTNKRYNLHVQPNWGIRVKKAESEEVSNEIITQQYPELDEFGEPVLDEENNPIILTEYPGAIYYNQEGFNAELRHYDDLKEVPNEISILPTGKSGQKYYNHNSEDMYTVKEDIQEIKVQLPSIGNAISDVYDLLYGVFEQDPITEEWVPKEERNLNVSWGSVGGTRMVKDVYTNEYIPFGKRFDPVDTHTLAGSINTLHDLLGMIITYIKEDERFDEEGNDVALEEATTGRLYFGKLGEAPYRDYYFKDKTYTFTPLTEDEIKEYKGGRDYIKLTQFRPKQYYTQIENDYYIENNELPTEDALYYKLGTPIRVNLKEWQPVDPETGDILYNYYIEEETEDFVKDMNPQHDETKDYYSILVEEATRPLLDEEGNYNKDALLIWNPQTPREITKGFEDYIAEDELIGQKIVAVHENGYFYLKEVESEIINPETGENTVVIEQKIITVKPDDIFDPSKEYYFVPRYAVSSGNAGSEEDTYNYHFIDNRKRLISFTDDSAVSFAKNNYIMHFTPFDDGYRYYSEIRDEETGIILRYKFLSDRTDIDSNVIYYFIKTKLETEKEYDENDELISFTGFYKPGEYYYWTAGENTNFFLAQGKEFHARDYFLLTDKYNKRVKKNKLGQFRVEPEDVIFYEPGKYYYRSARFQEDILDQSYEKKLPKDAEVDKDYLDPPNDIENGLVYYIPHKVYVIEDKSGVLKKGTVWDKNVNPPTKKNEDGTEEQLVILGKREDAWQWTPLKGFARTINTIHGLILELNKFFKFNDTLTRDRNTVQGCINALNDTLALLDNLNPGEVIVTDEYGRMSGSGFVHDAWIQPSTTATINQTSINILHNTPQEVVNTKGQSEDVNLKFGDTFNAVEFGIDAKGHVPSSSFKHSVMTIPSLNIIDENDKQILIDSEISEDGQSIVFDRENVGEFSLIGYELAESGEPIVAADTINQAFGKIQKSMIETDNALNEEARIRQEEDQKLLEVINKEVQDRKDAINALDMEENNSTTQFISSIKQTDGVLSVSRADAGTLILGTSYKTDVVDSKIETSDSINSAFGKLEYKLNILNGDSTAEGSVAYQIAQVVAGADASYDTLKEIADWINDHPNTVADINSQIQNLRNHVNNIETSTLIKMQNNIATNANKANDNANKLLTITQDIDNFKTEVNNKFASLDQDIITVNSRCNVLDVEVKNLINAVPAEKIAKWDATNVEVETLINTVNALQEKVIALESQLNPPSGE